MWIRLSADAVQNRVVLYHENEYASGNDIAEINVSQQNPC